MRSFYDLHLHIRWARFGGLSKSPEGVIIGLTQSQLPVAVGTWWPAPSAAAGKPGQDNRRRIL